MNPNGERNDDLSSYDQPGQNFDHTGYEADHSNQNYFSGYVLQNFLKTLAT